MIDRVGLESLSPARRAQLIYSEAQAAMSKRLWQAALGDGGPGHGADDGGDGHICPFESRARNVDSIDALLASLTREAVEPRPATERSRVSKPTRAAAALPLAALATRAEGTAASAPVDTRIGGLGPNACYSTTLAAAAKRVGVPAPALAAIIDAEAGKASDGSWKTYSRNPRSSAAGLGQFLNRTWEGLAETRGTWLNDHAARQGWLGADGQVRADSRAAVLATRYDATAAINGIADYARRNLDGLRRAGVVSADSPDATARFAYLGHHLGLGDAVRFLRGNGLSEGRAKVLLDAQVGSTSSSRRIAAMGDATTAHREWLVAYLDRNIRPGDFTRQANI